MSEVTMHKTNPVEYEVYKDATCGLLNQWYPALFDVELPDGAVRGVSIAGMPIVLRRVGSKIYALKDRCLHRNVKISYRPVCLNDETITCWYHGFSYGLETGRLVSIVGAPDDELIGKVGLQTFPVMSLRGIIFVFVGEQGFPAPPLEADLPARVPKSEPFAAAHILDEDAVVFGIHSTVRSNWRIAAENAFHASHPFVHRNMSIVKHLDRDHPLAYRPLTDDAFRLFENEGPKGVMNLYGTDKYDPIYENKLLGIEAPTGAQFKFRGIRTSLFLPGVLMVENFPDLGVSHFEWYVPIDDETNEYWRCVVANCKNDEEREVFTTRYQNFYEPLSLRDYNSVDIEANEEAHEAHKSGGWDGQTLCSLDASVVAWRLIVSRHNRGIQFSPKERSGKVDR